MRFRDADRSSVLGAVRSHLRKTYLAALAAKSDEGEYDFEMSDEEFSFFFSQMEEND